MEGERPRLEEFVHRIELPVRWSDMDRMAHVNNAAIVTYAESGRIAYFEELLEYDPKLWNEYGIILAQIDCSFLAQLRYPGEIVVGTRVTRIGRTSLQLRSGIFSHGEPVAATADRVVWFDYVNQQPLPIPDAMRRRIVERERITPAGPS
jgi:acyl-CoA thioester hydrolase